MQMVNHVPKQKFNNSNTHSLEKAAQSIEPLRQAVTKISRWGKPINPAQIAIIAETHAISADTIEDHCAIFEQVRLPDGRRLADSQIKDIFNCLQRLDYKQYTTALSDRDLMRSLLFLSNVWSRSK